MKRIGVLVGILAMAGMTETGFAGSVKPMDGTKVRVCLGDTPQRQMIALAWAKAQASKMFSTAGVTIDRRSTTACPADGIRIQFSQATKPEDHPGDSAYAMPYEGTTIVVFYDRLLPRNPSAGSATGFAALLAHVLLHEITHVLQGIARHSDEGVMKASFTVDDQAAMQRSPFAFTSSDVSLLHDGLAKRNARLLVSR